MRNFICENAESMKLHSSQGLAFINEFVRRQMLGYFSQTQLQSQREPQALSLGQNLACRLFVVDSLRRAHKFAVVNRSTNNNLTNINFLMETLCQRIENSKIVDSQNPETIERLERQVPQLKIVSLGKQEMMAHFRAGTFAGMKLCAYNPSNSSIRVVRM